MQWVTDPAWGCSRGSRDALPCGDCGEGCPHNLPETQPRPACGWSGWLPCVSCRPGCGYYARYHARAQASATGRWEDGATYDPEGNWSEPWESEDIADDGVADNLNPQQEEAASHLYGPCLVLAGAGSGKTKTLMVRIERLLQHASSREICAITFTRAAAMEMRGRVQARLGERSDGIVLTTFHSLALGICREHPDLVGRLPNFSVWDDGQQLSELRKIFKEKWTEADPRNPTKLPVSPSEVLDLVADLKNEGRPVDDDMLERIGNAVHPIGAIAYAEYEEVKRAANAMDYDDLIWAAVRMLEGNESIRDRYRERWKFLLVDEYQDTNDLQERLLQAIGGAEPNLMAVGDEDQSIYGFRRANVTHILNFDNRYPGARLLELGANYRCTPQIMTAADTLIRHNVHRRGKRLWSENPKGRPVEIYHFRDQYAEAQQIASMVFTSIGSGQAPEGHAVLCRTRRQMIPIQSQLAMMKIPYRTVGAIELFQRADIRVVLSWFKTVVNPLDIAAGAECMTQWPTLGAKTIERWKERVNGQKGEPMFSCVLSLLTEPGCGPKTKKGQQLQRFKETADQVVTLARGGVGVQNLARWLYEVTGLDDEISEAKQSAGPVGREGAERAQLKADFLALCPDELGRGESFFDQLSTFLDAMLLNSKRKDDEPKMVVSTIHGSKGLEWDNVWVPGMVESLLPHCKMDDNGKPGILAADLAEEERRLAYVAYTRAKKRLVLSHMEMLVEGDRQTYMQPSRFLEESARDGAVLVDQRHVKR